MSIDKYKAAQSNVEAPRQTEYRLFADVTKALLGVKGQERHSNVFYEAIDNNRRLWLALQTDLSSEDNKLPQETRASLISLAMWVDRYSGNLMRTEGDLEPLITVNRQIMEGLASSQP
jgi:flagellar protein FlaF